MGKSVGRPVVDLLGGAAREHVPFAAYLFYKYEGAGGEFGFARDTSAGGWAKARQEAALDPAGIVAQARAMVDHYGHKSIKLKGGAFPPQVEVDSILALREEFGPDVPLRLDPNAIWRVDTAIAAGKQLEGVLGILRRPDSRAGKYGGGRAGRWISRWRLICVPPLLKTCPAASPISRSRSSCRIITSGAASALRSTWRVSVPYSGVASRCTPTATWASHWRRWCIWRPPCPT